jgi:hypothetical protein
MPLRQLALRLAAIATLIGTVTLGTAAEASAATTHKSLTGKQLLAVVKGLHFAPHGYYSPAGRGSLRPLPASPGMCGGAQPASIQVLNWATRPKTQLSIEINQTKDAATAAKAYASLIDPRHNCQGQTVTQPRGIPANVRLVTQTAGGKVFRETLVTVEGNALVFADLQHPGTWSAHDIAVEHYALHRVVAAYRAATQA